MVVSTCAYCGGNEPLTKEHVFPGWLIRIESPDLVAYSALLLKKGVLLWDSGAIIKDACAKCNNDRLEKLDNYVRGLYERYFIVPPPLTGEVKFCFDYDLLGRWLLKVQYNSARHNGDDTEALRAHAEYMLAGVPRPKRLAIYLQLFSPATLLKRGSESNEAVDGVVTSSPGFGIGLFGTEHRLDRVERFAIWMRAYCFYVFLAPARMSEKEWNGVLRSFYSGVPGVYRLHHTYRKVMVRMSPQNWFEGPPGHSGLELISRQPGKVARLLSDRGY